MAREPLTDDRLDELELGRDIRDPVDERRRGEEYVELSRDPHPEDVYGVADMLICAAECFENAGDLDRGLELLEEAWEAGDNVVQPDPRAETVALLLKAGRREEAMARANELRKADSADLDTYLRMAEIMEEAQEDRQALAWITRGILVAEQLGVHDSFEGESLYVVRLRMRDNMGLPRDEDDLYAEAVLQQRRTDAEWLGV